MNARTRARLYTTTTVIGLSTVITVMGAPWKWGW